MGNLCQRRKKQAKEIEKDCKLIEETSQQTQSQEQEGQEQVISGNGKQKVRIALVGSQGVGKSTVFEKISFQSKSTKKLNSKVTQEIGQHEEIEIVCWTISEEDQHTTMNEKLLKNFDAIAFVVDRTRKDKLRSDGLLMRQFISSPGMLELPLLILINKSDKEGVGFWEVNQEIGLQYIQQREIHIQNCSAQKNEGVDIGLNKIIQFVEALRNKKAQQAK
ncbi:ADP-ribosylation factor family protein (macronuclear) [Tetrahymena thermophila SB210]|uniref:ADP-ribosylation factor family protein n=1 Tax=Tetrahymena thermophila (strain SB210) TaxID=312017 RepID=Q228N5_TETTS|nr:ADP-ribosylation factor family protein [Tetrahymena thermophila SB210]EAR81749.1 ADP-ribosylation factor family protein [Tetrahymena thermophila SB210]|eukprot:XP_001029412.1 ADP-ribosylation factor family protein [Tetrahymena thermophila SB210]